MLLETGAPIGADHLTCTGNPSSGALASAAPVGDCMYASWSMEAPVFCGAWRSSFL